MCQPDSHAEPYRSGPAKRDNNDATGTRTLTAQRNVQNAHFLSDAGWLAESGEGMRVKRRREPRPLARRLLLDRKER